MSTQTVSQLAGHWMGEIMQGKPQIKLDELRHAQMPDHLRDDLIMHGQAVLEDEINRIYDSPFLDRSSQLTGGQDPRNVLRKLLQEMMILPEHAVERIVTRVFRDILDTWRSSPLSIRMANDDPSGFAAEIFERAHAMSPADDNGISFSTELLSQVCESSGLELISNVIGCEEQMGTEELDAIQLARVLQRFLLLKEKYQVKRSMISYEGAGQTLAQQAAKAHQPDIPAPLPEIKPAEPVKGVENSSIASLVDEEAPPAVEQTVQAPEPEVAEDESFKTILDELPDLDPGSETVDDFMSKPFDESAAAEGFGSDNMPFLNEPDPQAVEKPFTFGMVDEKKEQKVVKKTEVVEKVAEGNYPSRVLAENRKLYDILMQEENIEEFSDVFFKDNTEEYKIMVINTCTHTSWKHARVAADNELFLNNVPIAAIPTQRFFKIMQDHFLS